MELKWHRVKDGSKPTEYDNVLLHTPQWGVALGNVITGWWDGSAWEAHDGRDFDGNPPIHWADIPLPNFEGDADEWSDPEFEDDEL